MMLCFLARCIDVNTDNKSQSMLQRAAHLKTETETFKYFSYLLCSICPLKNADGRKQKSLIKLLRERIPLEETYLDDSSTIQKMGSWRFFQED